MSHNNELIKDFKALAKLKTSTPINKDNRITKFVSDRNGDYAFLDDLYPCKVTFDGVEYPTLLHAFCASKTKDRELRAQLLLMTSEHELKKNAKNTIGWAWTKRKLKIYKDFVRQKFSDPQLASKLIATKDAEIIYVNSHSDQYWGMSRGKDGTLVGENQRGKTIMQVRKELVDQKNSSNTP